MIIKLILYSGILFIFSEPSAAPERARAQAARAQAARCALHTHHNQSLLALIVARRVERNDNPALIASRGPKRNLTYDPHYAYEAYWPGGEWVYKPYRAQKNICGRYKCGTLYKSYGRICARNNKNEVQTFTNYCEMMAHDCNGTAGWTLLNRGNCTDYVKTYQVEVTEVLGNVPKYLAEYQTRIKISKKKFKENDIMKQAIENIRNKHRPTRRPEGDDAGAGSPTPPQR